MKLAIGDRDAVELLEEVDVEVGAAELAVGDALEADAPPAARTTSRMQSSSTSRSSVAEHRPWARSSRLARSAAGRRKLPTWSARNGG